jgi:hypothetical protein
MVAKTEERILWDGTTCTCTEYNQENPQSVNPILATGSHGPAVTMQLFEQII